jgi:hypothetical protein
MVTVERILLPANFLGCGQEDSMDISNAMSIGFMSAAFLFCVGMLVLAA